MPVTASLWNARQILDPMVSPFVQRSAAPEKSRRRVQLCTTAIPPLAPPIATSFPQTISGAHDSNGAGTPAIASSQHIDRKASKTAAEEPQQRPPPCAAPGPSCAANAAISPSRAARPASESGIADAAVTTTFRQASDTVGQAPIPSTYPPRQAPAAFAARPLRLFDPPEELAVLYAVPEGPPAQFRWRGRIARITRWQGPERIAPEWWIDRPGARLRDYYKIEDAAGCRLWIYREGLAGDGRGDVPRWFVQGIFA